MEVTAPNIDRGVAEYSDQRVSFREKILPGIPLYIFLFSYLATTALGNLLYIFPFGESFPTINIRGFSWSNFHSSLGFEFWLLILLPFMFAPIAIIIRNLATPVAEWIEPAVPEISKIAYLIILAGMYTYAIHALYSVHAISKFLSAGQAADVVENRFALLDDLGFRPQMVLKSLLVFLSLYAAARAAREHKLFWYIATILNTIVLTTCLILLNMKWPAVMFILTLGVCTFVLSERHSLAKALCIVAIGIIVYLSLAVVLLRWFPPEHGSISSTTTEVLVQNPKPDIFATPPDTPSTSRTPDTESPTSLESVPKAAKELPIKTEAPVKLDLSLAKSTLGGIYSFAPRILISSLNRMAIAAPYYFDFGNQDGKNCAPELSRLWIKRDRTCEPTTNIYTQMFGHDGFEGRGTAPAAVNLYGYALAGWPGAIASTLLATIILGLFLSLWTRVSRNALFAAAFIMGAYTAYFFSQLPWEGPIIYDHGMIWWTLLVSAWIAVCWSFGRIKTMLKQT
jgi:hypothetical protein